MPLQVITLRESMKVYLDTERTDDLPSDAWLRTHVRVGGRIVKIAPYAMTVVGTVVKVDGDDVRHVGCCRSC